MEALKKTNPKGSIIQNRFREKKRGSSEGPQRSIMGSKVTRRVFVGWRVLSPRGVCELCRIVRSNDLYETIPSSWFRWGSPGRISKGVVGGGSGKILGEDTFGEETEGERGGSLFIIRRNTNHRWTATKKEGDTRGERLGSLSTSLKKSNLGGGMLIGSKRKENFSLYNMTQAKMEDIKWGGDRGGNRKQAWCRGPLRNDEGGKTLDRTLDRK